MAVVNASERVTVARLLTDYRRLGGTDIAADRLENLLDAHLRQTKATVTPVPKVAAKKKARPVVPVASLMAVKARSGGRCEHPSGCSAPADHVHHRAGRVGPDAHHPRNLIAVCEPCHRRIHAVPAQSYIDGTLLHRGSVAPDPLEGKL